MKLKQVISGPISAAVLASVLSVSTASTAYAGMFGYTDETGRVHLSTEQLDSRYSPITSGQNSKPTPAVLVAGKQQTGTRLPAVRPVKADPDLAQRYKQLVHTTAARNDISPLLLHAIISVESGYDVDAVSHRGARGLMQLMPTTAARFGVKRLSDPNENLKAGARYLSYLLDLFDNRLALAIAAYNAGEGTVRRFNNRVPPYPETQQYVAKVLATYTAALKAQSGNGVG